MDLRKLDALVAEHVMGGPKAEAFHNEVGWKIHHEPQAMSLEPGSINAVGPWSHFEECPFYSTDIASAWEVAEKFGRLDLFLLPEGNWSAMLTGSPDRSFADTAPLAICLSALKANGVDVESL